MRIAFDAKRIFNNTTGLGNYSRTILDNLYRFYPNHEYLLFTPGGNDSRIFEKYGERFPTIKAPNQFKNLWRSYSIRRDIEKAGVDVYHGLSNEIPFWLKNTKTVVTIHDVIFKVLPATYPQLDRWLYEEKTRYACRYADVIIAISENTKRDLMEFYGLSEERIRVIYQSCDPVYYTDEKTDILSGFPSDLKNLPTEFILSVGSVIKRKNLLSLVKAVQFLPKSRQIPIVVVGKGKSYKKKIQQYLQSHQIQHLVYWIDSLISKHILKQLYLRALVMVYPSVYEGFGLPVVEAMLCGTPVITSNRSSLPEAGGDDAIYVNPMNWEELSAAIRKITEDHQYRKELSIKGKEAALKRFNPETLTKEMMQVYQLVGNG